MTKIQLYSQKHNGIKRQRRIDFLRNKKCTMCGANQNLRLHHRNPATKSLKRTKDLWGWANPNKRQAEIDKCDIVCRGCHSRLHKYSGLQYPCLTFDKYLPHKKSPWKILYRKTSKAFATKQQAIEWANQFALNNFNNITERRYK